MPSTWASTNVVGKVTLAPGVEVAGVGVRGVHGCAHRKQAAWAGPQLRSKSRGARKASSPGRRRCAPAGIGGSAAHTLKPPSGRHVSAARHADALLAAPAVIGSATRARYARPRWPCGGRVSGSGRLLTVPHSSAIPQRAIPSSPPPPRPPPLTPAPRCSPPAPARPPPSRRSAASPAPATRGRLQGCPRGSRHNRGPSRVRTRRPGTWAARSRPGEGLGRQGEGGSGAGGVLWSPARRRRLLLVAPLPHATASAPRPDSPNKQAPGPPVSSTSTAATRAASAASSTSRCRNACDSRTGTSAAQRPAPPAAPPASRSRACASGASASLPSSGPAVGR
jgi:hypothetical protein